MLAGTNTAAGRAYDRLREDILDGTLEPGHVLFEAEQGDRLGMSRTPVREALRQLAAEGLVHPATGRGLVVASISGDDLEQVFQLRVCLESTAAGLAAASPSHGGFAAFGEAFRAAHESLASDAARPGTLPDYYALIARFEKAVDAGGGNPYLTDALETVRVHAERFRRWSRNSHRRQAISALERAIVADAIAAGDAALASHATHVHLANSLAHIRSTLDAAAPGQHPRNDPSAGAPPAESREEDR